MNRTHSCRQGPRFRKTIGVDKARIGCLDRGDAAFAAMNAL